MKLKRCVSNKAYNLNHSVITIQNETPKCFSFVGFDNKDAIFRSLISGYTVGSHVDIASEEPFSSLTQAYDTSLVTYLVWDHFL